MKDKPVILVVDDTLQNIELLEAYLLPQGYEIVQAASGEEALGKLSGNQIDLILLDVMMPGMDGFEVTRRVRQDDSHRLLPIILVTALRETEDRVKGIEAGCDDFISKPVDKMELLARVRSLLKVKAYNDLMSSYRKDLESEVTSRTEELKLALRFQQRLIDALPVPVFYQDLEDRYLGCNSSFEELFGRNSDLVTGKSVYELSPKELADIYHEKDLSLLQSPGIQVYESVVEDTGGVLHDVIFHKATFPNLDGSAGGLIGAILDITSRKRAEAERAQLLAQEQAQAQQIAQIMDTVPEGMLLLDGAGRVLLANPTAERDLAALAGAAVGVQFTPAGEPLTHLAGRPLAELLAAPPPGLWHEVQAGGHTFEIIARPIVGGPESGRWVLVIDDVTKARAVRDQLQQQERLAVVGQLAAGIAHDFNNILAIIALHAPLIARAPGLAERDRERLTIISEQTDHATRLIGQLLDFSRRAVLERRPLDLGSLLKEQVKLLARSLSETIEVSLACEPGEHVVLADPTRLQQMLMNLAVNARDAMPAGGTLRLALARQDSAPQPGLPDGPWVRLEVADSGTGIAPEALEHLFEPFFTTKPRGQGTGLGLAQVYGIVKQHGGEIVVHSAAGEGTTFSIYLPAVAGAAPAAAAPEAAAQAGGGETILLVEDNAALRDALCDLIAALGYEVVGASNGVEALVVLAARGDAIALVLSDLMMPVMGGEALLAAIRARGLGVPVVMLSGSPLEGELAGLKARGLAGWLLKPVRRAQLAGLLAQVLASPRSPQE
jgi:two-component system cell cycle sensor histidine kinase/response regulator CckA